jgi:pyruvate dehydrogenase E1 component beta subunit
VATVTYREALNQALKEEMRRDPRVFIMGEEVGRYHGAYKVSAGLLEEFGEQRVVDTPISELGFAGIGIGAAMMGLRPIIEMMTWNFAILALDQIINNAAKLRNMSGGALTCPVLFRGPQGAAIQLSSQHSQIVEAFCAHVPGLTVIAPSTPKDAKGMLKQALRTMEDPVCMFEGELLYNVKGDVPEGDYTVPLGVAEVKREGKDVTLCTWSRMLYPTLDAAAKLAQEGIEAEVVDMRTLRPLDMDTLLASVRKTNRLAVVFEGWPIASVGASIVEQVQREAFDDLDAPVAMVHGADVPMPYNKSLEKAAMPNADKVVAAAKQVLYLT